MPGKVWTELMSAVNLLSHLLLSKMGNVIFPAIIAYNLLWGSLFTAVWLLS